MDLPTKLGVFENIKWSMAHRNAEKSNLESKPVLPHNKSFSDMIDKCKADVRCVVFIITHHLTLSFSHLNLRYGELFYAIFQRYLVILVYGGQFPQLEKQIVPGTEPATFC